MRTRLCTGQSRMNSHALQAEVVSLSHYLLLWSSEPHHRAVSTKLQFKYKRRCLAHQQSKLYTCKQALEKTVIQANPTGVALTFEKLRIANAQHGKNCVSSPAAKATISTDLPKIDKHENTNV